MIGIAKRLFAQTDGSMVIETALVIPLLVMLSIGIFETGSMVARQHELQSAANEATTIVMAVNQGPEVQISEVETVIRDSVNVSAENLTISKEYRCNTQAGKVKDTGSCPESAYVSSYILISVHDTYSPTWTSFGFGKDVTFRVERSVQIS